MKYTCYVLTLAALMAVGCGSKKTVVGPGGTATVEENGDNKKTTINTADGNAVVEQNDKEGTAKVTATDASGKTTTYETSNKLDVSELGVDVYPGATLEEGQNAAAKVKTNEGEMVTAKLLTPDKPEKIEAFYKKLLKDATSFSNAESATVSGKTTGGDSVMITASWNKDQSKTEIGILVTKKK